MTIAVVDLGCGNVGSVRMALARLGAEAKVTSDAETIAAADRVVLPGVGSAGFAMERLAALGLTELLREYERPMLGICLGMQLMFDWSEEGDVPCLGLIPGRVRRLEPLPSRRIPHMGWSRLSVDEDRHGLRNDDYLWFAHSFACDDGPHCFARANDGAAIPAAFARANLIGCQFHPERSGAAGGRFLKKFMDQ